MQQHTPAAGTHTHSLCGDMVQRGGPRRASLDTGPYLRSRGLTRAGRPLWDFLHVSFRYWFRYWGFPTAEELIPRFRPSALSLSHPQSPIWAGVVLRVGVGRRGSRCVFQTVGESATAPPCQQRFQFQIAGGEAPRARLGRSPLSVFPPRSSVRNPTWSSLPDCSRLRVTGTGDDALAERQVQEKAPEACFFSLAKGKRNNEDGQGEKQEGWKETMRAEIYKVKKQKGRGGTDWE